MLEFLRKVRDGAVNMGYTMVALFVANIVLKYMLDPMGLKWTNVDFVGISLLMAVFIALGFYRKVLLN